MGNIYNGMTKEELEGEYCNLVDYIISLTQQMDECWKYNPLNPEFQNPIRLYEEIQEVIKEQNSKLEQIKNIINGSEKTN
jgi:hypothetical protein